MKRHAPATERNREAIIEVLAEVLPDAGLVLEVASGTGEHVAAFAERFPAMNWQPSDPDPDARASIAAWCADLPDVAPPLALDAASADWPIEGADAIVCINMVHIGRDSGTDGGGEAAARAGAAADPVRSLSPARRGDRAFERGFRAVAEGKEP
jgi:hypothetical protein